MTSHTVRRLGAACAIGVSLLVHVVTAEAAHLLQLVGVVDNPSGDPDIDNTFGIAISPDGKHVYLGDGYDEPGAIVVMSRDAATGQLTHLENVVIDYPAFYDFVNVAISPDGKNVYATSWEGTFIATYARDATTGHVTLVPPVLTHVDNAWDITFSADGTRLYLTGDYGIFYVYDRDPTTGTLTLRTETYLPDLIPTSPSLTPVGATLSPDEQYIYFTSYDSAELMTFRLMPDGTLDFLDIFGQDFGDQGPFYDEHGLSVGGSGVVVSPDGKHVYVSATDASPAGVSVFDRDAATGLLTVVDVAPGQTSGLGYLDTLAMHPDSRWIYATGDPLVLFHRDGVTGRLAPVEQHHDVSVGRIRISPDGAHVYVAQSEGDNVAVYRFMGCAQVPTTGCRHQTLPGKGSLVVRNDPDDAKDSLVWKWSSGNATALSDFGDPRAGTDYALCVYDQSGPGGTPRLLVAAFAPPGGTCRTKPCWKLVSNPALGDRGFDFTDALRTNDGLNKITLRQGVAGKAAVSGKVGGLKLGSPTLPLTGAVTAQLRASTSGTCWEATYSAPTINSPTTYRAKGD